jgi:hypothetical protein
VAPPPKWWAPKQEAELFRSDATASTPFSKFLRFLRNEE